MTANILIFLILRVDAAAAIFQSRWMLELLFLSVDDKRDLAERAAVTEMAMEGEEDGKKDITTLQGCVHMNK